MSIRKSLLITLLVFGIFQLAIGSMGFLALKNTQSDVSVLNTIVLDENTQLTEAAREMIYARFCMVRFAFLKAKDPNGKGDTTFLQAFDDSMNKADEAFQKFMSIKKMTNKGQELQTSLDSRYQPYRQTLLSMKQELVNNDMDKYVGHPTDQQQKDFLEAVNTFNSFASEKGNSAVTSIQERFDSFEYIFIGCLALFVILNILVQMGITRKIIRPLELAGKHFAEIAQGDLSHAIENYGKNEIGVLFSGLKTMQDSLTQTVMTVREASNNISTGAQEIATGNTDLSQRTEEQAASLEQTASSMEELTSQVKMTAENASQANQLAHNATTVTKTGTTDVNSLIEQMSKIDKVSHQISEITGTIESIAFQTNILALNAAVEAARAGSQGKGFAVVAGEVRVLAQRSADASKEIKMLIGLNSEVINEGIKIAKNTEVSMDKISKSITQVSDIMEEINASTREQSVGIEEVNRAVSQMDDVTQQNAALVEEAAAAAASLHEQTQFLQDSVNFFTIDASESRGQKKDFFHPQALEQDYQDTVLKSPAPAIVTQPVVATQANSINKLTPIDASMKKAIKRVGTLPVTAKSESDWETF
jgi:methyl-accepting chemotaxis protein-1 (serine sensor receptor)